MLNRRYWHFTDAAFFLVSVTLQSGPTLLRFIKLVSKKTIRCCWVSVLLRKCFAFLVYKLDVTCRFKLIISINYEVVVTHHSDKTALRLTKPQKHFAFHEATLNSMLRSGHETILRNTKICIQKKSRCSWIWAKTKNFKWFSNIKCMTLNQLLSFTFNVTHTSFLYLSVFSDLLL